MPSYKKTRKRYYGKKDRYFKKGQYGIAPYLRVRDKDTRDDLFVTLQNINTSQSDLSGNISNVFSTGNVSSSVGFSPLAQVWREVRLLEMSVEWCPGTYFTNTGITAGTTAFNFFPMLSATMHSNNWSPTPGTTTLVSMPSCIITPCNEKIKRYWKMQPSNPEEATFYPTGSSFPNLGGIAFYADGPATVITDNGYFVLRFRLQFRGRM